LLSQIFFDFLNYSYYYINICRKFFLFLHLNAAIFIVALLISVGVYSQDIPEDPCAQCQKNLTETMAELERMRTIAKLLQDRVSVLNYITWGVAAFAAFFGGLTVFFAVGREERQKEEDSKKQN